MGFPRAAAARPAARAFAGNTAATTMLTLFAILLGLVVGSFVNVCIVRLPRDESVVSPPSHCRSCGAPVAWHDNIPVASFVMLGGRCRSCGAAIPLRYPLVEVVTGVLFGMVAMQELGPAETALQMAIAAAMVAITFIDLDHLLILDVITLPSIAAAPLLAWTVGHVTVTDSLLGIAGGGGGLWAFAWSYEKLRGREGMGLGDVKLLAMIGGLLGWQAAPFSLLAGAVAGSLVGFAVLAARRGRFDMELPFGPFLAFGALLYMFAGPAIVDWWLGGGALA